MTVCIAGMHRSGTSMAARLLGTAGLYLGPDSDHLPPGPDNPEGFWENRHFYNLNEQILNVLGGAWDAPPALTEGWELRPDLDNLRARGAQLVADFQAHAFWGWKDPRNCLTFAFWKRLVPDVKVVICIRNPLEVVHSLAKRQGFSLALSQGLWLTYYQTLLALVPPEERIVTHYESFFADPTGELRRLLGWLGAPTDEEVVNRASAGTSPNLRHHWVGVRDLVRSEVSPAALRLYLELCDEAGSVYRQLNQSGAYGDDAGASTLGQQPGQGDGLQAQRLVVYTTWIERAASQQRAQLVETEQAHIASQAEAVEHKQAAHALAARATEQEQASLSLAAQVIERQQSAQALSDELAEKSRALAEASLRLAEQERQLQSFTAQMTEGSLALERLLAQHAEQEQALAALKDQLADRDERVQALVDDLAAKEQMIGDGRAQLVEQIRHQHELAALLANREKTILQHEAVVAGHEQILQALHGQLGDHGQTIVWLRTQLAQFQTAHCAFSERTTALEHTAAGLQALVAEREQAMRGLSAQITERDQHSRRLQAHLDGIASSRSWRLIHRIKRFRAVLLPFRRAG